MWVSILHKQGSIYDCGYGGVEYSGGHGSYECSTQAPRGLGACVSLPVRHVYSLVQANSTPNFYITTVNTKNIETDC